MGTDKILVLTVDAKEKPLRWLDYMLRSSKGILDDDVKIMICTDEAVLVANAVKSLGFGERVSVVDVSKTIRDCGLAEVSKLMFHGLNISPLQMFRLALPIEPMLMGYDKVVFSDVDVGFEDAKWNRVFAEDCEGLDALAVIDCKDKPELSRDKCIELSHMKSFASIPTENQRRIQSGEYYAAGLMVMNLRHLRQSHGNYQEFLKKMIGVCLKENLPQLDQSLINMYFSMKEISPAYNAWGSNSTESSPVWMRHFPGPQKVKDNFYPPKGGRYVPQEKMDIVYSLGVVSEHDDQELKWSLRSVAKYGRNVGRIIVTSPVDRSWLSDEVIQVDCQDIPNAGYKHHNILRSILCTIDVLDMHGEFLVSSDDHFYVRETDFARYPFNVRGWNIRQVDIACPTTGTNMWKTSCSDTGILLRQHNLPTLNFQAHANSHWNADIVRDELPLFKEAMKWPFCVEPHVLMQNLWLSKQPGLPLRYRKDAKILEFRGIDGIDCISCYDQTFVDQPFLDFMEREFGEKCRYER